MFPFARVPFWIPIFDPQSCVKPKMSGYSSLPEWMAQRVQTCYLPLKWPSQEVKSPGTEEVTLSWVCAKRGGKLDVLPLLSL